MAGKYSLAEQIELAQKALKEWPQWMTDAAAQDMREFDPPPLREPTCRHCGCDLPCGCWP